jgi:glycosyltransferase involved in cell wall biosynthesis
MYKSMGVHVVNSNYIKKRLIQHGFQPEQVTVVGYFTNIQPLPAVSLDEQRPIISFMGRIDRYKGVDYLMRALAHVSTPYRCSVIGDGDYLPYCKQLARKLGLSDVVDFVGWLSTQEIAAHLRRVSVCIVPSISPEAFGIVGIEAMMCSKPVVAFDAGGISDWLKDGKNGYLVPVKNTTLLAEKIEALLRDPQTAAKMGAEGRRLVTNTFSKEQHFQKLLSVFAKAAAGRESNKYAFNIVD